MSSTPQRTLAALLALSFLSAPALAQAPTALVLEGDLVPGVGAVTSIQNLAINSSGQWIVEADTDNPDTNADYVLLKNGALYLREGQALATPAGATLDSFDAVTLNAAGDSAWNFFLDGTTGGSDDSGIYFNDVLVIQEGAVSTAAGFSPGTPYLGFFETKFNVAGEILILASVDDPAIASSVDRAFVVATVNGAGTLLSEVVLYKEGDVLPGQVDAVADFATGPHGFDYNEAGELLYIADLDGSTATDGVVYLDGTLLAQEGSPSPVAGRNWSSLSTSNRVALSDGGDHVYTGSLDGSTTDNSVIIKNGALFRQEGETLPAFAPFQLTGFGSGPVDIDDQGNVLWFGDWDDPDTTKDTGLFLNDNLLVQEGVTTVGGLVIESLSGVQDGCFMSPDGSFVIFEASLVGGLDGAFRIDLAGCPTPALYCTAKVNSQGCTPAISSTGNPSASSGSGFLVGAGQLVPKTNGLLFYSKTGANAAPFQGGFLCVGTGIRRTGLQNSGGQVACSGQFAIDFNDWVLTGGDAGLVAGTQVWAQYWSRDPAASFGTNLSDAITFLLCP